MSNRILNIKIQFFESVRMSKQDFECQNSIFLLSSNVKIGFCMSKYDFPTQFEFQNRILNIIIAFSELDRMSKNDFDCQNSISRLSSNIKIGFWISNSIFRLSSNVKIGFWMTKYSFPTQLEFQNRISDVKIAFSDSVRISE